jgi:hypothetical protein
LQSLPVEAMRGLSVTTVAILGRHCCCRRPDAHHRFIRWARTCARLQGECTKMVLVPCCLGHCAQQLLDLWERTASNAAVQDL